MSNEIMSTPIEEGQPPEPEEMFIIKKTGVGQYTIEPGTSSALRSFMGIIDDGTALEIIRKIDPDANAGKSAFRFDKTDGETTILEVTRLPDKE